MHARQARFTAVLAAMEDTGLSKSVIASIAGVHRSQVSRWFSGEHRPGYEAAMRVAGYLQHDYPELAARFIAAAGYGGPAEPDPDPISPDLMDSIRRDYPPKTQNRIIDLLRRELNPPNPPTEPGEEGGSAAQPGAGLAARWYAASAPRCACRSPAGAGT